MRALLAPSPIPNEKHLNTINSVTVSDEEMNDGKMKPSRRLPVRVNMMFDQVQHLFSVFHLSISEDEQLKREQIISDMENPLAAPLDKICKAEKMLTNIL